MDEEPTTIPGAEPPAGEPKRSTVKLLIVWIVVFGVAVTFWQSFTARSEGRVISYNRFQELVEEGKVHRVSIRDRRVFGTLKQPIDLEMSFELVLPFEPDVGFVQGLIEAGVVIHGDQVEESPALAIFLTWGPVLLIVGLWIYFMRAFAKRRS